MLVSLINSVFNIFLLMLLFNKNLRYTRTWNIIIYLCANITKIVGHYITWDFPMQWRKSFGWIQGMTRGGNVPPKYRNVPPERFGFYAYKLFKSAIFPQNAIISPPHTHTHTLALRPPPPVEECLNLTLLPFYIHHYLGTCMRLSCVHTNIQHICILTYNTIQQIRRI